MVDNPSRPLGLLLITVLTVIGIATLGPRGYNRAQESGWVRQVTGPSQFLNDLTVDDTGSIYITGYAAGDHQLDSQGFSGFGAGDAYLARFLPDSSCAWIATATSAGWNGGRGIAPHPAGGVYWAGRIEGVTDVGGYRLDGKGGNDAFVARVSEDGIVQWALSFGGPGIEWANAVATTTDGGCVAVGQFQTLEGTGLDSLQAEGGSDIFVLKVGPDGSLEWIVAGGGVGADAAYGVTVHPEGWILVAGSFEGTLRMQGHALISVAPTSGFIACLDETGRVQWLKSDDTEPSSAWILEKVVSDEAGRIVAVGSFWEQIRFGASTAQSNGDADLLVLTIDPRFGVTGLTTLGGPGRDGLAGFGQSADAVILDGGSVVVATSFSDSVKVGQEMVRCAGFQDILVVEFDDGGRPERCLRYGETAFEGFTAIDAWRGRLLISGNFTSVAITVQGRDMTRKGSFMDGFLAMVPWEGR